MSMDKSALMFILIVSAISLAIFSPELYDFVPAFLALGLFALGIFAFQQIKKIIPVFFALIILTGIGFAANTVEQHTLFPVEQYSYFGTGDLIWTLNVTGWTPPNSVATCTLAQGASIIRIFDVQATGNTFYDQQTFTIAGITETNIDAITIQCVGGGGLDTTTNDAYIYRLSEGYVHFLILQLILTVLAVVMLVYYKDKIHFAAALSVIAFALMGTTPAVTMHATAIKYLIAGLNTIVLLFTTGDLIAKSKKERPDD